MLHPRLRQLSENLFCWDDTCKVYILRAGEAALLVDFGSGEVLDALHLLNLRQVQAILMTHHHRDQGQGLPRAAAQGIPIWVPHTEQDFFHSVDAHWQARELTNNYNMREDRFSLLEPVPVAGTLQDYASYRFGNLELEVIPTPGHSTGAITLWLNIDGQHCAFTGDLIAAPGKLWSLAATQWTYNGVEGVAASVASLLDLRERQPDLLLPSHGEVMSQPGPAIDLLVERLWALLQLRGQNKRLFELRAQPYAPISPHLLQHRASMANSYVLLSDSGRALFFDFGYDFITGIPAGSDRASRRPWLYTLPALKAQFGVQAVDVVLPTHFHDDHVAGINLLRRVEGAQVWAADFFSDILENPSHYDLPCLWYDPIPVDRRLPLEQAIQWEEYSLTLYPLPGHTRYAVAIALEVDGRRVLVTGDQYQGNAGLELNYVYRNLFHRQDYIKSAALYARLNPALILTGHWEPFWVPEGYWEQIATMGATLAQLHDALLPESPFMGDQGFLAELRPYQAQAAPGTGLAFTLTLHNPFDHPAAAEVRVVLPPGWQADLAPLHARLEAHSTALLHFQVRVPPHFAERRQRLAVDLTLDGQPFGQQAEALISAPNPSQGQV